MRFTLSLSRTLTTTIKVDGEPVLKLFTHGRVPVDLELDRPRRWMILGIAGTGKSSLLETLAYIIKLREPNTIVIDVFGSVAGEGLAWLRSPLASKSRFALLHNDNVSVTLPPLLQKRVVLVPRSSWSASVLEEADFVIVSSPLFNAVFEDEFDAILRVLDSAYRSFGLGRRIVVLMREASEILAPRKRRATVPQKLYNDIITMTREARHRNMTLLLDTYKFTGIDVDYRTLADFIAVKKTGLYDLPPPLDKPIYRHVSRERLMNLPPDTFVLATSKGQVGIGWFKYPFWHRDEKEDMLKALGIKIRSASGTG